MAKGMSFKVLLELQAKQFQKQSKVIQRGLDGIKKSFLSVAGTLVGGLGLSNLFSNLRDTSKELDAVRTTLRNVSNDSGEFASNMRFLQRISKEYGQDLLASTQAFAKFRAAGKMTNMTLEQQRDVFEALSKAAGSYGLSADQASGAFLAVEQMMSKGKVSSEELRQQLSERLPGAMILFAKAAGMAGVTVNGTVAELEDAMKKGKVLAEDVLPAFAQLLNTSLQNANFNTLQGQINRLKNAWVEFVNSTGVGNFFKGITSTATNALEGLTRNFQGAIKYMVATLSGAFGAFSIGPWVTNISKDIKRVTQQTNRAIGNFEKMKSTLNADLKTQRQIVGNTLNSISIRTGTPLKGLWSDGREFNPRGLESGRVKPMVPMTKSELTTLHRAAREMEKIQSAIGVANRELSILRGKTTGLGLAFQKVGMAIKTAFSSIAMSALIGAISALIGYVVSFGVEIYKAHKYARDFVKNTIKEIDTLSESTEKEIVSVKMLQKQLSKTTDTSKRQKLIDDLNKKLGLTGDKMLTVKSTSEEINTSISKWVENIKKAAKAFAAFNKLKELEENNLTLELRNEEIESQPNYSETKKQWNRTGDEIVESDEFKEIKKNKKQIDLNNKAIQAVFKYIEDNDLEDFVDDLSKKTGTSGSGSDGGGSGDTDKSKLQKALESYNQKLVELKNQRDRNVISEEEYAQQVDKTVKDTYSVVAALSDLETLVSGLSPKLKETFEELAIAFGELRLKDIEKEILSGVEEYIKNVEDQLANELDKLADRNTEFKDIPKTEVKERDTTKDYKLSKTEILGEDADHLKSTITALTNEGEALADALKTAVGPETELLKKRFDEVVAKIVELKTQSKDLNSVLTLAEYEEYVKGLKDELKELNFNNIQNIAGGMSGLVEGFERMADTFKSLGEDSTPLDVFKGLLDVINQVIQTLNTLNTIMNAFNTAIEITDKLKAASAAKEAIISKQQQADSMAKTSANMAEGVSGAIAANSKIPIVGIALAADAVAGIIDLFASSKNKFAQGGIVGGNSLFGDKIPIRVNSGEMILNRGQQANLFRALNNGNFGTGSGEVKFKIRGTDLVGVMDNYKSKLKG